MNEVKVLQKEVSEMAITLRELAVLETYDGADYSEIKVDLAWIHQMLRHRLQTLQNGVNRREY